MFWRERPIVASRFCGNEHLVYACSEFTFEMAFAPFPANPESLAKQQRVGDRMRGSN